MNSEYESLIRQVAQFLTATLSAHGFIDGSNVQAYTGLITSILIAVWGFWRTRQAKKRSQAAVTVATEAVSTPRAVSPEIASEVVEQKIADVLKNGH